MTRIGLAIAAVLFTASLAGAVVFNGINANGTAGACVAVPVPTGTATPTIVVPPRVRKALRMAWAENTNISCEPILLGQSGPALTPTTSVGVLFVTPVLRQNALDDASYGWSCVAVSTTANVCTEEDFQR